MVRLTHMTIIMICILIITMIMIKNEYIKYRENSEMTKLIYGTDDYNKIEKINKKIMKQNEKMMKELRDLYIPR